MSKNKPMRSLCVSAWLLTMLIAPGCGSGNRAIEASQSELWHVDHLWQESVPVEYANEPECGGADLLPGETSLLIPYTVSRGSALQVELYGCWDSPQIISCQSGYYFTEAEVNADSNNRVTISLKKEDRPSQECPATLPRFAKSHTFDINGAWQLGEIEVIVRNGVDNLTGFVTVE